MTLQMFRMCAHSVFVCVYQCVCMSTYMQYLYMQPVSKDMFSFVVYVV